VILLDTTTKERAGASFVSNTCRAVFVKSPASYVGMAVLFIAKQGAVLALLLFTAAGAGTLAAGPRGGIALRSAIGLALCAHAMFFLAAIGQLRILPIVAVMLVAMAGGLLRGLARERPPWLVIASAPVFFLALFPPVAFDETLYHLPFVRAFAATERSAFCPTCASPFSRSSTNCSACRRFFWPATSRRISSRSRK
jgi:hypothetical protein